MGRRAWTAACAALLAVGPPLAPAAASPAAKHGAAGVGDPVYPYLGNGGYDVQSYDLDLAYGAQARWVSGTVRIAARAGQDLTRFNLDAHGLDIAAVTVDGARAAFARRGEELMVTPKHALRRGLDFVTVVTYATDPRRVPQPRGGFVPTEDGFATAPRPAGAHTVFPCNDHPSDKALLTVRLTVPPGLTGVATGRHAQTITHADGSATFTYTTAEPVATHLVQLSVGRYLVMERGLWGGTAIRDVAPVARVPATLPSLSLTRGQLTWATDRLGPFPLEAYGILVADTDATNAFTRDALATQTLTLYKPGSLTQPEDRVGDAMMRQLVHGWFGSSVTPKDWSAAWLAEGHAYLYGLLYRYDQGWSDEQGNLDVTARMRDLYRQADAWRAATGPVARPRAATMGDERRALGAALALYALLEKVGPEIFTLIERKFLTEFKDRSAGTEDFLAVAERTSADATLPTFVKGWLYGTKTPPMPNHPDWTSDPVPGR
jgi:aminopeptidase N